MRWWLSGKRDLNRLQRLILYSKWRMQQYFHYGKDTFVSVCETYAATGKVPVYHKNKVNLNLNNCK